MISSSSCQINPVNPRIVISGAGPAGLTCALKCLKEGYFVSILEKRAPLSEGRAQTVILDSQIVDLLQEHRVYEYLLKYQLSFPMQNNRLRVRLTDLEKALKHALKREFPRFKIQYEQTIEDIRKQDDKICLTLKDGREVTNVDYLVNAEGFRSKINELTKNPRVPNLATVPVVVSILRDDRPSINGVKTFTIYLGKTVRNIACFIYYLSIYIFKAIFCHEHFFSQKRALSISQTLKTPGQHNVSYGFTKFKHDQLVQLHHEVKSGQRPQKDLDSFVAFWTHMALCEVTVFASLAKIAYLFGVKEHRFSAAPYLPLRSYSIVDIQSDQLKSPSITIGHSRILNIGNALATVDPTTGLGCNQAIEHSTLVLEAIGNGAQDYDEKSKNIIGHMHEKALELRQFARPDLYPPAKID